MPSARAGRGTSSATTPAIFRPKRDGENVQGSYICVLEINIASWLGKVGHLHDVPHRPADAAGNREDGAFHPALVSRGAGGYVNRRFPEGRYRRSLVQSHGGHPCERHDRSRDLRQPSRALDVHDLHPEIKVRVGETDSPNFSRCELSRQLCDKKKIGRTTEGVWFT
jgi:hypothetical protein